MTFPPVSRAPERTESTNLKDGDHAEIRELLHSVPVVLRTYFPTAAFDGWLTDSNQLRLLLGIIQPHSMPCRSSVSSMRKRHLTHLKYGR